MFDGDGYSGRQMFASFGLFHQDVRERQPRRRLRLQSRGALVRAMPELAARIEPLHQGPSLLVTAAF